MDKILELYNWVSMQGVYFAALFIASEAIGMLPIFKDSSVFQAVVSVLRWLKDKFPKRG